MDHYLLTERIVEYLSHFPDNAERPAWLTAALQTCWQSSEPFRAQADVE